jgi:hypothetical protein
LLQERRARRSEIPTSTVVASERLSPTSRERVPLFNGERHRRTIDCAGQERILTISRPLAEASGDSRFHALIISPRHGAYSSSRRYRWAAPSAPGWVWAPDHPAHRGNHWPEVATRRQSLVWEQSSPRFMTMKHHDKPFVAGVVCQSTHLDPRSGSQRPMSRDLQPQSRQVRIVYRCWKLAVKVSFSLTFADPRRAFQAAMLSPYVVATGGDRT